MKYALLLPVLFSLHAYAAIECTVRGQMVVVESGSGRKVMSCENGLLGGLSPDGFPASRLASALEQYKNDPAFMRAMTQVGLGNNYQEMLNNINGSRGLVSINGDAGDQQAMALLSQKINEHSGATAAIAEMEIERAQQTAAREKRDSTPVALTPEKLTDLAAANLALSKQITPGNCREIGKREAGLKMFQVHFEDGEKGLLMPLSVKKNSATEYEVTMQNAGVGWGGLAVAQGTQVRKLKFQGGKVIWVGKDAKEFPIRNFSELKPADALGGARPFGWGSTPDTCLWARNFEPAAGSTPGDGQAPAAVKN